MFWVMAHSTSASILFIFLKAFLFQLFKKFEFDIFAALVLENFNLVLEMNIPSLWNVSLIEIITDIIK